jgi:hypothetical protein
MLDFMFSFQLTTTSQVKGLANFTQDDFIALGLNEGAPIEFNWEAISANTQPLSTWYEESQSRFKRFYGARMVNSPPTPVFMGAS